MPEASPLASTMMSGTTPKCSAANILPVRPMPDCTSSNTSRMPCASHSARRPAQELGAAARCSRLRPAPARPRWPPRRRAPPVREQLALDAVGVAVLGVVHAGQQRAEVLAVLRLAGGQRQRAQACARESRRGTRSAAARRVWWRASLIAASTASVPELVRNVCQPARSARPADCRARQRGQPLAQRAVARVVEVGAADVDQRPRPAPRWPPPPAGWQWPVDAVATPAWRRGRRCRRRPRPCSRRRAPPSAGRQWISDGDRCGLARGDHLARLRARAAR